MATKHTEVRFEDAIQHYLTSQGGYETGDGKAFDAKLGLFPDEVISFVSVSQPKRWQALCNLHGSKAVDLLLSSLIKELNSKTVLTVLRHGFKCYGKTFRMAFFQPNTSMNPETLALYEANRLRIMRQVHFSTRNKSLSVDVVLSVNGLPLVTLELKNAMSGQTTKHAIYQYKTERDPREPIFEFKKRSLVHFAVDTDEAWMTTRLNGGKTVFLPFNKGYADGKGNPAREDGRYRTSYLWDDVLAKDGLMEILSRFMHLQIDEKTEVTENGIKRVKKETMIFPRYHQRDVVRALVADAKAKKAGHNYLIQHSAGSGKSNSIAWLAHRLSSLHDDHDEKVFDTVVVITDRQVLDRQLQDTIYQFEHKQGVVQKIDTNTQKLAKSLADGTPIIISTIQKFPFIAQALETLEKKGEGVKLSTAGKRFAVIVDEAHSSQSGETAAELRKVLNQDGIANAVAAQILDEEDDGLSPAAKENMLREAHKRPRQPNLSFFAFTATPKYKTQVYFNEPNPATNTAPFHKYTMKQAIEEGYIKDVLKNYTTFKVYKGLVKAVDDDPHVKKRPAAKALARYMDLHPHNIGQKVRLIVEHFRTFSMHKIGGKAKAMVVTESRLAAVRYKNAFDAYIREQGYTDVNSLVAFSGSVVDEKLPGSPPYTEVAMNGGIKESELPEHFGSDSYQVLLVAEKYQTGFDQPLLHTMYVDKRLSGIQAVQTLSRLNRNTAGKEDTFVLDFVNTHEDIYAAFKPFYQATPPGEPIDPHRLYELQHKVEEWRVYTDSELNAFCEIWFKNTLEPSPRDHEIMDATLNHAVERYRALDQDEQDAFKGHLASFRNLYGFLSQVIPYHDSSLEKLYAYGRFLLRKLPKGDDDEDDYKVEDDVELKYYRLEKVSEGRIDLSDGEPQALKGPAETGTGRVEDELVELSSLVDRLNDRFGTEFTKADQLFFDQVTEAALENEKLEEAAKVNTVENFELVFNKMLTELFVKRIDGNEKIFAKLMSDDAFRKQASKHLTREVYNRFKKDDTS